MSNIYTPGVNSMVEFAGAQTIKCDNEDLWLAERLKGVGASESPVLFGPEVTAWGSKFSLWAEKTGQVPPAPVTSDAAKWGRHLEGPIALAYAEETGRKVVDLGRNTLLRSRFLAALQCTLDRVIEGDPRGLGVLEIKNVGAHKLDEWIETPPLRYVVQLQHQMAVTGAKWGALAALVGGQKFIRFDVDRDDAFIESLFETVNEFWRCVETKTPPPVDGSEATAKALAALYKGDNGKPVELPPSFAALDAEWQRLKEQSAAIERREREIKNQFQAAIGDAERGVIVNGPVYVRQLIEKKPHTVKASSYRQLRRIENAKQ